MGAFLGLILHGLGGFAAGSFYLPFKLIKSWSWETSWFVLGLAAWILCPFLLAWATTSDFLNILFSGPIDSTATAFIFGLLWGIGGLTFGLSMRYLGMSLGMGVALGFTAAFGTLIPPLYEGRADALITTSAGIYTLLGIVFCLLGIVITCKAGMLKEAELTLDEKQKSIKEFNLKKGISIAIVSGILSACFAFGLQAGKPLAKIALQAGTKSIFQNNLVLVWVLWGGFLTNSIWTIILNIKNKSIRAIKKIEKMANAKNFVLAIVGGITWYFQFFFYGMGSTLLGNRFEFASWTIHISFILLFSTLWGIYFKEWKGVSRRTTFVLWLGLTIIAISTIIIGLGAL